MIKLSDYGYQVLQIETYGLCNMECGFCPYPSKSKNAKTSKLEGRGVVFRNLINSFK